MTVRHPVRRFLARVCSADTMSRIVDPTLADLRVEDGRLTWRGAVTLARALVIHVITSTPAIIARVYSEDERAIPRAAGVALLGALAAALAFVAPPLIEMMRQAPPPRIHALFFEASLLLLPQAVVLTLPAGLLLAFPLVFRNRERTRTLRRRALALAAAFVVVAAVVMVWGVPRANQAFRELLMDPRGHLAPGPNEMGFGELREHIDVLKLTPGGRVAARRLDYLYSLRIALISAPLPLGVLALALASTPLGRRRPWLIGTSAVIAYICALFPMYVAAEALVRASALPPWLLAWLPTACIVALAATAARFGETDERVATG
jgi:lipopolysaccharide export LptBFGC system permease protein LptF